MRAWGRTTARAAAVLVLAGGAVPMLQGTAWACSCAAQQTDTTRYAAYGESETWRSTAAKAATVYLGEVVRETYVDPEPLTGGEESYEYEVRVVEPLKGSRSGTRTLSTPAQSAACGTRLRTGRILVVDDSAGLCGPTTQEQTAPRAEHVRTAVQRRTTVHVVAQGETVWKIARTEAAVQSRTAGEPSEARVRAVVQRLKEANAALRRSTVVRPGQRIRVPALQVTDFSPDVVAAVCRHMDDDHADDALAIVRVLGALPAATAVRTTSVDSLGIDFAAQTPSGVVPVRVPFAEPAHERAQLRTAVVALHARAAAAS